MNRLEMGPFTSKLRTLPINAMLECIEEYQDELKALPFTVGMQTFDFIDKKIECKRAITDLEYMTELFCLKHLGERSPILNEYTFRDVDNFGNLHPVFQIEIIEDLDDNEKFNIIKNFGARINPQSLLFIILSLPYNSQVKAIETNKELIMKAKFDKITNFFGSINPEVQAKAIEILKDIITEPKQIAEIIYYLYDKNVPIFFDIHKDIISSYEYEDFWKIVSILNEDNLLICNEKFKDKFYEMSGEVLMWTFLMKLNNSHNLYKLWTINKNKLNDLNDTFFNLIISRLVAEERFTSLSEFKDRYNKTDIHSLLDLFEEDSNTIKLKLFLEYPEKINELDNKIFTDYISNYISKYDYRKQIVSAYKDKISRFNDEDFIYLIHSFTEEINRYAWREEEKEQIEEGASFLVDLFEDRFKTIKEENISKLFKNSPSNMQNKYLDIMNSQISELINNRTYLHNFLSSIWGIDYKKLYDIYDAEFQTLTAYEWYSLKNALFNSSFSYFGKYLMSCDIDNIEFISKNEELDNADIKFLNFFVDNFKTKLYTKWEESLNLGNQSELLNKYNELITTLYEKNPENILFDTTCIEAITLTKTLLNAKLITNKDEAYNRLKEYFITSLTDKLVIEDKENINLLKDSLFYRVVKGSINIGDLIHIKTLKGLLFVNRNNVSSTYNESLHIYHSCDIENLVENITEGQSAYYNLKLIKKLSELIDKVYEKDKPEKSSITKLAFKLFLSVGYDKSVKLINKKIDFTSYEYIFNDVDTTTNHLDSNGEAIINKKLMDFMFGSNIQDENTNINRILEKKIPLFDTKFSTIYNQWTSLYNELQGNVTVAKILKYFDENKILLNPDEYRLTSILNEIGDSPHIVEKACSLYRDMKARKTSTLPKVKGKNNEYTYEVLDLDDPLGLAVGYITRCCFLINGESKTSLFHSAQSRNGRIFVVYKDGQLVAQSWIWRNGNLICFDNVETTGSFNPKTLLDIYKDASNKMLETSAKEEDSKESAKLVTFGGSYSRINKPDEQVKRENLKRPIEPNLYSDAKYEQYILASKETENLYYGEVKASYKDERSEPVRIENLEDLDKEQKSLTINKIKSIDFIKNKEIREILLSEYEYVCIGCDWYILIKTNGEVETCFLSIDEQAKIEFAQELIYIKDTLINIDSMKYNSETIKTKIKEIINGGV